MGTIYEFLAQLKSMHIKSNLIDAHIGVLQNAGITSLPLLIQSCDILDSLKLPPTLKQELKDLTASMGMLQARTQNQFFHELHTLPLFQGYKFAPQPRFMDYLLRIVFNTHDFHEVEKHVSRLNNHFEDNPDSSPGLSTDQITAVALYTTGDPSENDSFYRVHNKTIRDRMNTTHDSLLLHLDYMFLLDTALQKLPGSKVTAYRGISVPIDLTKFVVGNTLTFASIVSASTWIDTAITFANIPPIFGPHEKTLFKMNFIDAKFIKDLSVSKMENEVVASYCSKWKVLSTQFQSDNNLVELQQLISTPLFNLSDQHLGIDALRRLRFSSFEDSKTNVRSSLAEYVKKLDPVAADLLPDKIRHPDGQSNCTLLNDLRIWYDNFVALQKLFEILEIPMELGFKVCKQNDIQDPEELINKSLEDPEALNEAGFSMEIVKKIADEEHIKKELEVYWNANRHQLNGTSENPENFLKIMKTLPYQAIWKEDLYLNMAYCAGNSLVDYLQLPFLSYDLFYISRTMVQSHDFVFPVITLVAQYSLNIYLWYRGDLTTLQAFKTIVSATMTTVAACTAQIGGFAIGAAIVGGTAFGPGGAVIGGLLVSIISGLTAGFTVDVIVKGLLEKYFPDGIAEEMNAKRKVFADALQILGCDVNMSQSEIAKRYRRLALQNHPDKKGGDNDKFVVIALAWETIKTYHNATREAFQNLRLDPDNTTLNDLNERWAEEKKYPDYKKFQKDYEILYQFLNKRFKVSKGFIRKLFDRTVLPPQHNAIQAIAAQSKN